MASVSAILERQTSGLYINWTIYGLGNQFTPTYYSSIGIATEPVSYQSTSVSGVIATKSSSSSTSGTTVWGGMHLFPYDNPGETYTIYGFAQTGSIDHYRYYPAGECTVVVPDEFGRPEDWHWHTSGISKGSPMAYSQSGTKITPKPLTAAEWLDFIDRIEEFADYLEVSLSSTYLSNARTGVSRGSAMTATQVNAARYLINQLDPPLAVPASVGTWDKITASFVNGLKNSLNSIE